MIAQQHDNDVDDDDNMCVYTICSPTKVLLLFKLIHYGTISHSTEVQETNAPECVIILFKHSESLWIHSFFSSVCLRIIIIWWWWWCRMVRSHLLWVTKIMNITKEYQRRNLQKKYIYIYQMKLNLFNIRPSRPMMIERIEKGNNNKKSSMRRDIHFICELFISKWTHFFFLLRLIL
jgi:hypothetical protein